MLGHKTRLNKFRKIKIMSSNFSNHKGMKIETNYKEIIKPTKYVKSKQYATKQPMDH